MQDTQSPTKTQELTDEERALAEAIGALYRGVCLLIVARNVEEAVAIAKIARALDKDAQ